MVQFTLAAELRTGTGKGAARAARRAGRVPGIIYGTKAEPVLISVEPRALMDRLDKPGFYTHIFEIEIGGKKHRTLAREVQFDPVSDRPIHVDFMRFGPDTRVSVGVPVKFRNHAESPGLKRGGVLNVVRHTIEMRCRPDGIPEFIMCDLSGLDIGNSLHIESVELPPGVELTIKRNFTVATITAPTILVEVEETPAAAEGELVPGAEGVPVEGIAGVPVEGAPAPDTAPGAAPSAAPGAAPRGAPGAAPGTAPRGAPGAAPRGAPAADSRGGKGKGRGDK